MSAMFKNPSQQTPREEQDLSFQVMPNLGKNSPPVSAPLPVDDYHEERPVGSSGGRKKLAYIIIAIVALLIIGALGYFLLWQSDGENSEQAPVSKLPASWVQKQFDTQTCTEPTVCGDDADPDKDGLKNYDEFRSGTTPSNSDTDGDGLADGDEVFIYNIDPTLKFTDRRDIVAQNNWTDGFQIKNGYDPLTPALKFTENRLNQISQSIQQYKLHEPTITTLGDSQTPVPPPTQP